MLTFSCDVIVCLYCSMSQKCAWEWERLGFPWDGSGSECVMGMGITLLNGNDFPLHFILHNNNKGKGKGKGGGFV